MKFQDKTKKLILVSALVIYIAMFICTFLCAYWTYKVHKQIRNEKCSHSLNRSNAKPPMTMKNIKECLNILAPDNNANGKCEWLTLKDSTQVGIMENYYVEDVKVIPAETLKKIIDKKFYSEYGDFVNYGIYMPIVRISYTSAKGKNIAIVYSFANAQFNLYRNDEMVKEGRLDECKELEGIIKSL